MGINSNTRKKEVILYTDGACSGNPGVGGWGLVLMFKDSTGTVHKREESGAEGSTTNNRMEISAVIHGLNLLKTPCSVTVYSDSSYVCNAIMQGWLDSWQKNGWKNSKKEAVKNPDLWQEYLALSFIHDIKFVHVKGHADNEYNNRCDTLATTAVKEWKKNNRA